MNSDDPLLPWMYRPPQKPAEPPSVDWSKLIAPKPAPTPSGWVPWPGFLFPKAEKPAVFVSYQHEGDQSYYNRFSELFAEGYDLFRDTSVDREIDSDDPEYQSRAIRQDYITGSSITVVLCGAATWKRKHVDWEIHATLEKKHALLGIILPTCLKTVEGKFIVPDRLHDDLVTGYAALTHWTEDPRVLASWIQSAKQRAEQHPINNRRQQMPKNLP